MRTRPLGYLPHQGVVLFSIFSVLYLALIVVADDAAESFVESYVSPSIHHNNYYADSSPVQAVSESGIVAAAERGWSAGRYPTAESLRHPHQEAHLPLAVQAFDVSTDVQAPAASRSGQGAVRNAMARLPLSRRSPALRDAVKARLLAAATLGMKRLVTETRVRLQRTMRTRQRLMEQISPLMAHKRDPYSQGEASGDLKQLKALQRKEEQLRMRLRAQIARHKRMMQSGQQALRRAQAAMARSRVPVVLDAVNAQDNPKHHLTIAEDRAEDRAGAVAARPQAHRNQRPQAHRIQAHRSHDSVSTGPRPDHDQRALQEARIARDPRPRLTSQRRLRLASKRRGPPPWRVLDEKARNLMEKAKNKLHHILHSHAHRASQVVGQREGDVAREGPHDHDHREAHPPGYESRGDDDHRGYSGHGSTEQQYRWLRHDPHRMTMERLHKATEVGKYREESKLLGQMLHKKTMKLQSLEAHLHSPEAGASKEATAKIPARSDSNVDEKSAIAKNLSSERPIQTFRVNLASKPAHPRSQYDKKAYEKFATMLDDGDRY